MQKYNRLQLVKLENCFDCVLQITQPLVVLKLLCIAVLCGNPTQSYGVSLATWDHGVTATRHK